MALALAVALLATAEWLCRRHYLERTYSYYAATEVYWEDAHTLLLYLPDPKVFWSLRPSVTLSVTETIRPYGPEGAGDPVPYAWRIEVNDDGFRGPPLGPGAPDELRILCLGDSRTLGEGLQGTETWPRRLERILRGAGRNATVINAAADGWSAWQGRALLRERADRLKPDVVLFCFGINDADRAWGEPDSIRSRRYDTTRTAIQRTLYRSFLFYALQRGYLKVRAAVSGGTPLQRSLQPDGPPRVSREEYGDLARDLVAESRRIGAIPVPVILPLNPYYDWSSWTNAEGRTVFQDYADVLTDVTNELESDAIVFSPAEDYGSVFIDDMHLSARGADLLAHQIAEHVISGIDP